MTREEAARVLTELADYEKYEISKDGWLRTVYIPAHLMGAAALRGPVPDPDTGLVPCGWCDPDHYLMRFNVQFWVRASTGKRKWMSVTQQYKKQVNYCPMCGRKLEVEG